MIRPTHTHTHTHTHHDSHCMLFNSLDSTKLKLDHVCFSWRYNPLWLYFHSPAAGFSLLVFDVS